MIKELTHFNNESVIDAVIISKLNELIKDYKKRIDSDAT